MLGTATSDARRYPERPNKARESPGETVRQKAAGG